MARSKDVKGERLKLERLRPLLWRLSKENKQGPKDWSMKIPTRPPLR